jgi:DNA-binding transcriptional LysR family regulator
LIFLASIEMDLHQLRMFAAVAELGNLTHAAERLHISQPAASAKIKLLEEELKVALFERRSSGLTPTPVALALLPKVRQMLVTANEIMHEARGFSRQVYGVVKFGVVSSPFGNYSLRMTEMLDRILTRHPLLDIELQHGNSRTIKNSIIRGELDVGLVASDKNVCGLHYVFLQELAYRATASKVWRERVCNATRQELASLPWVSCTGTQLEMTTQLFEGCGCRPEKIVKANSDQLIASLVMAGAGLGLMSEDRAVNAEASGVFIINGARATTNLGFVYRVGREDDPTIRAILQVVHELWPHSAQRAPDKNSVTTHQREPTGCPEVCSDGRVLAARAGMPVKRGRSSANDPA